MSHDHSHHHAEGNIKVAFFLNLIFTLIEIVGGFYTNSMAILSDALHDLGDSLSLGLAWYFQKLSTKDRDKKYSYGYRRFSLLGAIVNSTILTIGSIFIILEAIPLLWNPSETNVEGMMVIAVFGIIVNGAAVLRLRKGKSINEQVVSLHLLEDVLGWVAVLIGGGIMLIWDFPWIDPLLSILIAIYVLVNVVKNLRKSLQIILQATPKNVNLERIHQKLLDMDKVKNLHDCHAWTLDGDYHILTVHLVLDKSYSLDEQCQIKSEIRKLLGDEHINHLTVEFEMEGEDCSMHSH